MTRIYLFIMLGLLSALPTFAQKQEKTPWTVRYGIEAGVNGFNANTLNLSDHRGRLGAELGGKVEIFRSSRPSHSYMSAGIKLLLLRSKELFGGTQDMEGNFIPYRNKEDAYYLHIPIHGGYKWKLWNTGSLFVEAGPYMAIGLGGHSKTAHATFIYDDAGEEVIDVVPATTKDKTFDDRRRFEMGIGAKLGMEVFRHWQAGISYEYALTKMRKHGNDHNANFTIFAAFMF